MNEAPFLAGFGKGSLTVSEPGWCMWGWGHPANVAQGVAMPLEARAMVLEDRATSHRIVHVVCDLGMISASLRRAVVHRVCTPTSGLDEHDLMLTATHTHAGPSGFSTHLFYALTGPGVSRRVHDTLVDGIVTAIREALDARVAARAWVHAGSLPATEPVAFNRSIRAYNRNPDVVAVDRTRRDEALDRTTTVLRVDDARGGPLGLVAWFAVHGTSVHSDFTRLHGDNKGCAARDCEAWAHAQGHRHFVALFAQECAGDVTPNHRWHAGRGRLVGRFDDDEESAQWNGEVQSRFARSLHARAPDDGVVLTGPIDRALRYCDLPRLCAPDGQCTTSPTLGLAFALGTREGEGPLARVRAAMPWLRRLQAHAARIARPGSPRALQGAKFPLLDLGIGAHNRFFGRIPSDGRLLDPVTDRFVAYYRRAVRTPWGQESSWVPQRLPVQQFRIGTLVIGALPNEPTTVAGRRLRGALRNAWRDERITHVVVNGYANAYAGYLTTPEEYDTQAFEGAATLYGRGSLPVFTAELASLTRALREGDGTRSLGVLPVIPTLEHCLAH